MRPHAIASRHLLKFAGQPAFKTNPSGLTTVTAKTAVDVRNRSRRRNAVCSHHDRVHFPRFGDAQNTFGREIELVQSSLPIVATAYPTAGEP